MRKLILTALVSSVVLMNAAVASSGDNYNYSNISVGAGFHNYEIGSEKIDGTSGFVAGSYKLSSRPVFLKAGYSYVKINEDELVSNVDLNGSTYLVGAGAIISPASSFDLLPSVSVGRLKPRVSVNSSDVKETITVYSAGLEGRFHVESGLWLNVGYAYQKYNEDGIDNDSFYSVGAEYATSKNWGLGLKYTGSSDQNVTQLFLKLFY